MLSHARVMVIGVGSDLNLEIFPLSGSLELFTQSTVGIYKW